jgi:hypothetical protein
MQERKRYQLATIAAETAYNLLELEARQKEPDLDEMMRRLKDLSAYSLTHAEIMDQREGVELLALARFFGMTSDQRLCKNQERLSRLSEETLAYKGRAELIEEEVAHRKARSSRSERDDGARSSQPRLF